MGDQYNRFWHRAFWFGLGVVFSVSLLAVVIAVLFFPIRRGQYVPIAESEFWRHLPELKRAEIGRDEVDGEFMKPLRLGNQGMVLNFAVRLPAGESASFEFHRAIINGAPNASIRTR